MENFTFIDWQTHPWAETAISAVVAIVLMLLVYRIGRIFLRRLAKPNVIATSVLDHIDVSMRWVLPLIGLQLVWNEAAPTLHLIDMIRHVNYLLLIAALTALGVRAITGAGNAVEVLNPLNTEDNLHARRIHTQMRVIMRMLISLVILLGLSSILLTFPGIRQIGLSLLASAGVVGLVAGIAAKPVLGNLIAGLQIALTQPIRLEDVVIVEGEWGWVEEITGTYVVIRVWDERRLVVPLQWFIENPFQNWTRTSSQIIGSVFLWVDYRLPLNPLRTELSALCEKMPEWDKRVCVLQATDTSEHSVQLRILVSSTNSSHNWDLRCTVREGLIKFIQEKFPEYLPCLRIAHITPAEAPHSMPSPPAESSGKAHLPLP